MSISQTTKDKIVELKKERQQYIEKMQELFTEGCKELFDNNPELESFGWNQYAPAYNDGDPCEFSVRNVDNINEEYGYSSPFAEMCDELVQLIDEDAMKEKFGDCHSVTVNRDGTVDTDDYENY